MTAPIDLEARVTVLCPSGAVRAIVRDLDDHHIHFAEPNAPPDRSLRSTARWAEGTSWLRGWDDDAPTVLAATRALSTREWDLHTLNAAALFDKPPDGVTPAERSDAKRFVMGNGYGATMDEIAKAVGVPLANVKRAFVQMVFPGMSLLNYRDEITVWHDDEAVFATVINPPGAYATDRKFGYAFTVAQDGFVHGESYTYNEGRAWLHGWTEENKAILGATAALTLPPELLDRGDFFGQGPALNADWIIAVKP